MHPSRDHLSPDEIERQLYETEQFLDGLFPQSEAEVCELQMMFGSTPVELPQQLREPSELLKRIVSEEALERSPSEFGKLVTILRTEKQLSVEQLAEKTDLDVDDLRNIESKPGTPASPLVVSTIAEYFKLEPRKLMRVAGLTREPIDSSLQANLSVAACAKPNFDALTREEKAMFHEIVKQLRKKA